MTATNPAPEQGNGAPIDCAACGHTMVVHHPDTDRCGLCACPMANEPPFNSDRRYVTARVVRRGRMEPPTVDDEPPFNSDDDPWLQIVRGYWLDEAERLLAAQKAEDDDAE